MSSNIIDEFKLKSHTNMITCISVVLFDPSIFATGSRDCTILIWKILQESKTNIVPKKRIKGHFYFISDLCFSLDGSFLISSSWDKTLNLWDIKNYKIIKKFIGHQSDILSVEFSKNNKQIISSSRDNSIKIWNTIGHCKMTLVHKNSSSWISCAKFISNKSSIILSCSWNGIINIWNVQKAKTCAKLLGHKGYLCCLSISPDSSLCASGGKDGIVMLWDLQEIKHLYSLNIGECINCLCFCPNRYWLCAGTSNGVKIWDLESKVMVEKIKAGLPNYDNLEDKTTSTSMNWIPNGNFFISGFVDGKLKIYHIRNKS